MPGGYRVFTVKGIATPFTARNAEHAGGMDIWTPGLNWRLTPIFAVSVNYRRITLNRFGSKGKSSGVLALVVLLLE